MNINVDDLNVNDVNDVNVNNVNDVKLSKLCWHDKT